MNENRQQRRHRAKQKHTTKPARIRCSKCGLEGIVDFPEYSYCDGCDELHPAEELTPICPACEGDMTLEWL